MAALEAEAFVDTERSGAFGADPARAFLLDESGDTGGRDHLEVFEHTHAVFRAVTTIEAKQRRTRELGASGARGSAALLTDRAGLDRAAEARDRFSAVGGAAAGALIPGTQMGITRPAIHAAWRDEIDGAQCGGGGWGASFHRVKTNPSIRDERGGRKANEAATCGRR